MCDYSFFFSCSVLSNLYSFAFFISLWFYFFGLNVVEDEDDDSNPSKFCTYQP